MREKLIEIINEVKNKCRIIGACNECTIKGCQSARIADAIIDSGLFCNGPDAMDEQEPHVYQWTAVEDDGYTHSEFGVANNMYDAFIEATEHSPSYHKKVVIEKIPDDELMEDLKEFYREALACSKFEEKENDDKR